MKPTFRTLKVEDGRVLHALMVEHVDSLEEGLTILGERVLLGEGTVDLVAHDGEGRLVLIAIAFVADDVMVLRMLEAFAWCLEYPGVVGRLYPVNPDALVMPPRVMFVSGRLSDAFLRKVKHLRMPSIDCLEFRYLEVNGVAGLHFNPVDIPRTLPSAPPAAPPVAIPPAPSSASSPRPVPSAPPRRVEPIVVETARVPSPVVEPIVVETATVPSPVVDDAPMPEPVEPVAATTSTAAPAAPVPPAGDRIDAKDPTPAVNPVIRATTPPAPGRPRSTDSRPAELLKGLQLPDNLSSQWQRILDRAVEAPAPEKIRAVREYLQSEFPGCVLYDFHEHQRSAQTFHLQNSRGDIMHAAAVAATFLEATAERDIRPFLERNRVAGALRDAGKHSVLITLTGLEVAKG